AMALVFGLFRDPKELGKAMGIWGASAPAGGTAGVFLGGVITQWISWRWTFLINVPISLLVLALIPSLLPKTGGRRGRIDFAGAATITAAISLAVYAVVDANNAGWRSLQTLGLLTAAAALLVAFVLVEQHRREPLVRLAILRSPNLAASLLAGVGISLTYIPALVTALAGTKPEEAGLTSGLVSTSYQVGSALGLAVMTAVATSATGAGTSLSSLNHGYHAAFLGAAAVAAAAALAVLLLIRRQPA